MYRCSAAIAAAAALDSAHMGSKKTYVLYEEVASGKMMRPLDSGLYVLFYFSSVVSGGASIMVRDHILELRGVARRDGRPPCRSLCGACRR